MGAACLHGLSYSPRIYLPQYRASGNGSSPWLKCHRFTLFLLRFSRVFFWINASKFIVVFDSFTLVLSLFFWGEDLLNSLYIHSGRPISYTMFWQQWLNSSCSVKEWDSLNSGENYQSSCGNQLPLAVFLDYTCCLNPLLKWMALSSLWGPKWSFVSLL